jgi:hypothetical protein
MEATMHRFVPYFLLMVLLFPGCSSRKESALDESTGIGQADRLSYIMAPPQPISGGMPYSDAAPQNTEAKTLSTENKIIKTAHLEFQVNDIEKSKKRISQLVNAQKGYIANLEEVNDRTRIQASFTIRVPASVFDHLVENILNDGIYVNSSKIERRDVTAEFLDLKARMETQKALESRYREILRQARNVEEILKVEAALGSLREEIEAKEGRMKYLAHQAEYSTILVSAYQTLPYAPPPKSEGQNFVGRLASSLVNGWAGLVDFTLNLISAWPALILFCALFYLTIRWVNQRRHTGANKKDSATMPESKS